MEVLMGEIMFIEKGESGLTPVLAGYERCRPSHSFGPAVRKYYLLHFCLSGKGTLYDKNGTHRIGAGEFFVIRPDEVTTYTADADEPWEYTWIGFLGSRADNFRRTASVIPTPSGIAERLYDLTRGEVRAEEPYISLLYELVYRIFTGGEEDNSTERLRRLHRYLKFNYMKDLRVSELAREYGFDRSHLYRVFKARYGIGIKEYLTRERMANAARLLADGFSVSESAAMVGYTDAFNFSKAFKEHFGVPPSKYVK